MKKLLLFVLLVSSVQQFCQDSQPYRSQTQYIKLMFSELMSTNGLFDKTNYVVYDESGDTVLIERASYPVGTDTTGGLDYCILATERWKYDVYHTIKAFWVKDRAGNLIGENNTAFTFLPLVDPSVPVTKVRVGPEFYQIDTLKVDTVWASGQENADRGPEKAIDGIGYLGSALALNCWTSCCLADAEGQWFIAGFNQSRFIEKIIVSGTYYYNSRSYGIKVLISQDNISWEDIGNFNTTPNVEWSSYSIGRNANYIKLQFLTNSSSGSDWAGLWELKVIGN